MISLTQKRFTRLPDAILLDLDNTLYPYEPAHTAGMTAVRAKVTDTLSIKSSDFDVAFHQARAAVQRDLAGTAASHSRLLYFQRMLEHMGLGSQILLVLDLEVTYWRAFLNSAVLFEGVGAFLDDVRLLGIPMAIVTDLTAQIQFRKILYFELDKYFDCIVTSEETGFDKPHPAPFESALKKLAPQGSCIWMIGDSPEADIQGARSAINALTLQKLHAGAGLREGSLAPDTGFREFEELRIFMTTLG